MSVYTTITNRFYIITNISVYDLNNTEIIVKGDGCEIGYFPFINNLGQLYIQILTANNMYKMITIRTVEKRKDLSGNLKSVANIRAYINHQAEAFSSDKDEYFDSDNFKNLRFIDNLTPEQYSYRAHKWIRHMVELKGDPVIYDMETAVFGFEIDHRIKAIRLYKREVNGGTGLYEGARKNQYVVCALEEQGDKKGIHFMRYGFRPNLKIFHSMLTPPEKLIIGEDTYNSLMWESYQDGFLLPFSDLSVLEGKKISAYDSNDVRIPLSYIVDRLLVV